MTNGRSNIWRLLRWAGQYYAIAFGAGFVLGVVRVVFLVPSMGVRVAELLEIPVMLVIISIAGLWIAAKLDSLKMAIQVGGIALALLLGSEVGLAALLFGKTPTEALFHKDPVSGAAYYLSLVAFAVMPWFMFRLRQSS